MKFKLYFHSDNIWLTFLKYLGTVAALKSTNLIITCIFLYRDLIAFDKSIMLMSDVWYSLVFVVFSGGGLVDPFSTDSHVNIPGLISDFFFSDEV